MNNLKRFIVDLIPVLAKYIYVNRGLDIKKEVEEEDDRDYVMGAFSPLNWKKIPNADWEKAAEETDIEFQDDMDCTGHSMKNIIQMVLYARYGLKISVSAAYINTMAGTSRLRGNSMTNVLEAVRKFGWVTDEEWPEENRWKKIPKSVIDRGIERTKEYNFGYDRVYPSLKAMGEAEQYSPLYTGGFAWYKKDGVYITAGRANHCFTAIKQTVNDVHFDNKIKDSYPPHIKNLASNYQFMSPRRILIEKNPEYKNEREKELEKGTKFVIRADKEKAHGEFYVINKDELVYIKDKETIDALISKEIGINIKLEQLTALKKVKWITEDKYKELTS